MTVDFREEQLNLLAGTAERAKRVEAIADKYDLSESDREKISAQLSFVRAVRDKSLKIAVVGEFSAGKSSFINALMREEILETGAAQGTTRIPVIVEYGADKSLYFQDENGALGEKLAEGGEELSETIRRLNEKTENAEAKRIILHSESEFLKKGICVIDTPGTDSLDKWHELAAKRSIAELADGCVVLTTATHPMPETLCGFIENSLPFGVENCIFLVTKIDLLKSSERDTQLEYVTAKIRNRFNLKAPAVLPYSSLHVLRGGEERERSLKTEEKIRGFLAQRRVTLRQAASLTRLHDSIDILLGEIDKTRRARESTVEELNNSPGQSLAVFLACELERCRRTYNQNILCLREDMRWELKQLRERSEAEMDGALNGFKKISAVRNFYNSMGSYMESVGKEMTDIYCAKLSAISGVFLDIKAGFEENILSEFEGLSPITEQRDISPSRFVPEVESQPDPKLMKEISGSIRRARVKQILSIPVRVWIGIFVCYALGFFIFDSNEELVALSACLGAAAGAASHFLWRKRRINKLRKRTSDNYIRIKAGFFDRVITRLIEGVNNYADYLRAELISAIGRYSEVYGGSLNARSAADSAARLSAENSLAEALGDMSVLRKEAQEIEHLLRLLDGSEKGEA